MYTPGKKRGAVILGLGTDIIEISRIEKSLEEHGAPFLKRLFTEKEQAYCEQFKNSRATHYAGRFAAKEAIAKALGTGIGAHFGWHDVEILPDPMGKPTPFFSAALEERHGPLSIFLSISHCKAFAQAVALWHGK